MPPSKRSQHPPYSENSKFLKSSYLVPPVLLYSQPRNNKMRTECFVPSILPSSSAKSDSADIERGVVMTRGWCKTEGIIGSAFTEMDRAKVAAYIFAPRPSTKISTGFENGVIECDVSFAPHAVGAGLDEEQVQTAQKHLAGKVVDAFSSVILLDKYPKSVIYITAVVLEASGSELCCLLNCVSLALCDALVELRDVLAAYSPHSPSVSSHSQSNADQLFIMASMPRLQEIALLDIHSRLPPDELGRAIDKAKEQCDKMRDVILSFLK